LGRRCLPVESLAAALEAATRLTNPLLVGELEGRMPEGFDLTNSPAQLALRSDIARPAILLSSSGTQLICAAAECEAVYLACFRNCASLSRYLIGRHPRIAVIGAGSRNEFREEDQMCCAWIAAALLRLGYEPGSPLTAELAERWRAAPPRACLCSRSVEFLKRSGQLRDLEFILAHIDDLNQVFEVRNGEVKPIHAARQATCGTHSQSGISI